MPKLASGVMVAVLAAGRLVLGDAPGAATMPMSAQSAPAGSTATTMPAMYPNPNPDRYLFEDQLRPGMKGYGLTVMKAGTIERFDVEIVDVIKNFGPGTNAILVKCSGLGLEHSGIIAGMSGSPVFVEGKMIGAVAFGWGASKDPIGGVQPIRQMLSIAIPEKGAGTRVTSGWAQPDGVRAVAAKRAGWAALAASLAKDTPGAGRALPTARWTPDKRAAQLRPLAAPVMVSGMSPAGMKELETALAGTTLTPLSAGAAGGGGFTTGTPLGGAAEIKDGEIKLEPGSSIALPLLAGDIDISAVGTVTEVADKKVYAFGHAMLADGPSELPIATGYIYTIMPSLIQSFKLGGSFQQQGSLVMDEQTGIVGMIGRRPALVPVTVAVKTGDKGVDKTYHYELAQHPRLGPAILGAALRESIAAHRRLPAHYTARLTGQLAFVDGPTLKVDTLQTDARLDLSDVMLPVAMLTDNPYANLKLKSVEATATIEGETKSVEIKSVTVKRTMVAPGEDMVATVELTPYQQPGQTVEVRVKVPAETPEGDYELAVGTADDAMMQEAQYFPQRFAPDSAKALAAGVQRLLDYRRDRLYARMILEVKGAAKGTKEMGNLPPSRVAMYGSDKRTNTSPVYATAEAVLPVAGVLEGSGQTFTITVAKDANKRFWKPSDAGPGLPKGMTMPHSGAGPKMPRATGPGGPGGPGDGGDGGDGGEMAR